jgi:transcriptional regulator with XRE-family HTH domain
MTPTDIQLTTSTTEPTRLVRQRKAALALAGLTQKDIGDRCGASKQAVNMVIRGISRNPRIRVAIAEACGMSVEVLFPQTADAEQLTQRRAVA